MPSRESGDGLGCTVHSEGVEDNFNRDGMTYRQD